MLSFTLCLATLAPTFPDAQDAKAMGGTILHEPETGASLTLPAGWEFATGEGGLIATSADKRGFVLLAAAEENFEQVQADVRALVLTRLDNVTVARSEVQGIDERGAIEALIQAVGEGVSRIDGGRVEFLAVVAKAGDGGALALGAWKDEANAKIVAEIMEGFHIQDEVGKGDLVVTDTATGASVAIPEGWSVVRSRKGLVTASPDGGAMIISLRWQQDFERELREIRALLTGWLFKDIKLGEFAAVEASYDKSVGRVLIATGTAVDRTDGKPVQFNAMRLQRVDKDEGAALFGVWKSPEHAEMIKRVLGTVKLKETAAPK